MKFAPGRMLLMLLLLLMSWDTISGYYPSRTCLPAEWRAGKKIRGGIHQTFYDQLTTQISTDSYP